MHAPWALALAARLRESLGIEVQSIWSDDGIALHLPDADAPPSTEDLMIDPEEIEELVVGELSGSALFGARFRENAARALLIPRRRPGQRTPLWQQRLKAQSLLQVARKYGSFPIILETYRECLQDVFDLPALRGILRGLKLRELDLVDVESQSASPFSSSLLFDYVATYMYEDDTPPAERRAQALSLDRDLLRELLGQEELRELIDPGALEEVEAQLRGNARNPDELHDVLRRRGDLREGEYDAGFAETLIRERRAFRARVAGDERLIAAEDAGRYRDALGVMPPGGLPDAFLTESDPATSLEQLVLRFAKGRGPFTTGQANEHFGRDVEQQLRELEREEKLIRGELRPGGTEREWCDPDVLRRLRRASLAALRKEVEPAEQATLGRFLPSWHGIDRRATLREALVPLQGLALPVKLWESEVLPRRVPNYQPLAARPALRVGRARLGRRRSRPRRALLPRGRRRARPPGRCRAARDRGRTTIRDALATRRQVLVRPRRGDRARARRAALPALWDLVWAGEVTNDAWTPLRAGSATKLRGRSAFARAASRDSARTRTRRRRAGGRSPTTSSQKRPTAARSRSCSSSVRESSRETACARKESPAATARCTASFVRSRRSASAAAATSSRGSAVRSSRSPAVSSDCGSCDRATTTSPTHSCSPRPTRRSPTAQRSRGRSARAVAQRAWPARTSCCSAESRRSTSSAEASRSSRSASPTRTGCARRLRRSSRT